MAAVVEMAMGKFTPAQIAQAKRGKISNEQAQAMADATGHPAEYFLKHGIGTVYNVEDTKRFQNVIQQSSQELAALAKKAVSEDGTPEDLVNFHKAQTVSRSPTPCTPAARRSSNVSGRDSERSGASRSTGRRPTSRTPTIAFAVERHPSAEVARALARRAVFVSNGDFYATTVVERLGHAKDGLVRAGCVAYTTVDEVERLIEGVRQIAGA